MRWRRLSRRHAEVFRASGVEVRVEPEVVRLAINLPPSPVPVSAEPDTIRRLADYQRISGVLWIVLGIVQLLSVYGIIAGLWNIPVGIGRLRQATRIRASDETIPAAFEGVVGLVVIGVINLILGGVIGVIVVGLDFWIRDRVLKLQGLFTEVCHSSTLTLARSCGVRPGKPSVPNCLPLPTVQRPARPAVSANDQQAECGPQLRRERPLAPLSDVPQLVAQDTA